jgi:transposase
VQPQTIEFVLHWGRCQRCGRRARGRHPRQVSDAVTVGQVHFGPGLVGLSAYLQKVGGLSYGKIIRLLADWMGLSVARSTLCRALARLEKKVRPIYDGLVEALRGSPVVYPDETSWRVAGRSAWLWAVTHRRETVYAIHRGRGFAEAASILGEDFAGILGANSWIVYRCFEKATIQACLAHLLRRCHELLETATPKGGALPPPGAGDAPACPRSAAPPRCGRDQRPRLAGGAGAAAGPPRPRDPWTVHP